MKKLAPALVLVVFWLVSGVVAMAQGKPRQGSSCEENLQNVVQDLSSRQKRQLETISQETREKTEPLKTQLHAVRDSIRINMEARDDRSAVLDGQFKREAELQMQLNRQLYRAKVRIDAVLTEAQHQRLEEWRKSESKKRPHCK